MSSRGASSSVTIVLISIKNWSILSWKSSTETLLFVVALHFTKLMRVASDFGPGFRDHNVTTNMC